MPTRDGICIFSEVSLSYGQRQLILGNYGAVLCGKIERIMPPRRRGIRKRLGAGSKLFVETVKWPVKVY